MGQSPTWVILNLFAPSTFHGQKQELHVLFQTYYLGVHIATNLTWKINKFSHISPQDLLVKDTRTDQLVNMNSIQFNKAAIQNILILRLKYLVVVFHQNPNICN